MHDTAAGLQPMTRLLAKSVSLALILLGLWAASGPLLKAIGAFLVVDQSPEPADAIVVLPGSFPDRILEAVDLYDAGFAPEIVLCREPENPGFRTLRERGASVPRIYENNVSVAMQLGVPAASVTVLQRAAGSTFTEARVVLQYLADRGANSMLLVTSKFHTRRAGAIYRHLAGGAIKVITRPARDGGFDPASWWHDRMSIRRLLIEYQKLALFQLYDRWKIEPQLDGGENSPQGARSGTVWRYGT